MKSTKKLFSEFPPVSSEAWFQKITEDLKGQDFNKKLVWNSIESLSLKPYYRKEDLGNLNFLNNRPGQFPYNRGYKKEGNTWLIRQDIPVKDVKTANKTAREYICNDVHAIGFSIKKNLQENEIMELLEGIDLCKTSLHIDYGHCYHFFTDTLIDVLYNQGNEDKRIEARGSLNIDPLAHLLIKGSFHGTEEEIYKEIGSLFPNMKEFLPSYKIINVRGDMYHNAGAHTVQELAYTLAAGNEILSGLSEQIDSVDTIAERMQFTMSVASDYFFEIAKIRAFRILWAYIVKAYNPEKEESTKTLLHAVTSLYNKSIYDPYTNMLRNTTETMAAILGGADMITVHPFDAVFRDPDNFSIYNAQNLQHILREESYLDKVADPAGGSYYIETLTNTIAEAAWNLFLSIEKAGGFTQAVKMNMIQDQIDDTLKRRKDFILKNKEKMLGTTIFPNAEERILDHLNKEVFPEAPSDTKAIKPLYMHRKAMDFEKLRLRTEMHEKNGNKVPKVFLLPIGNPGMSSARQIFSGNFFACAGFEIIHNARFASVESGVKAAMEKQADMIVICSSDEEYKDLAPEIVLNAKEMNKDIFVLVAGYPGDIIKELKEAGVDDFIHIRSDLLQTLESYLVKFNIN
jgi:methylmalonyl-CoA mutase